jgi:hypothetical protein
LLGQIAHHEIYLLEQFTHAYYSPDNKDEENDLCYEGDREPKALTDKGIYRRKENERKKKQENSKKGIVSPKHIYYAGGGNGKAEYPIGYISQNRFVVHGLFTLKFILSIFKALSSLPNILIITIAFESTLKYKVNTNSVNFQIPINNSAERLSGEPQRPDDGKEHEDVKPLKAKA